MNLNNSVFKFIDEVCVLCMELEDVLLCIVLIFDEVDMIKLILYIVYVVNGLVGVFILDQVVFFFWVVKDVQDVVYWENLWISVEFVVSFGGVFEQFDGLIDVLMLCDFVDCFDGIDEFICIV